MAGPFKECRGCDFPFTGEGDFCGRCGEEINGTPVEIPWFWIFVGLASVYLIGRLAYLLFR